MVVHILCGVVILLENTNQYAYVFCSAEGLWKAEEKYKSYILGVNRLQIILTFQNETLACFHTTS